ncbi:MAG: Gfo/Idh/MocA family oxidoreductase [Cyclobacteriaceae bacterium]
MKKLRGVCVGAGYFSQFHYDAWSRLDQVEIVALCDLDEVKTKEVSLKWGVPRIYSDFSEMLEKEQPDFVDIITPPAFHLDMCTLAAKAGTAIICQKPLAPSLEDAKKIAALSGEYSVPMMVHENFRFQPWHREIKKILESGALGDQIFYMNFRMRMGDGWQQDAYMSRQPYFRTMPRLLIYETGIHFVDIFRYLAGEPTWLMARLKKLNKDIVGEDSGVVHFEFDSGVTAILDGNRYNESNSADSRYTFGEFLIEGNEGSLRLYNDGNITIQKLGESEKPHNYHPSKSSFAGDCVYATQKHFIDSLIAGNTFETSVEDYLKNVMIQEAIYESSLNNTPCKL